MAAPLIIGVGNEFRGDDGVGIVMARRVGGVEASGEGASLMDLWQGEDRVLIIDAVQSGAKAGTVYRIDAARETVPTGFFHYSSHLFGVAEAIEMARVLRRLPEQIILFGVEGRSFGMGDPLSAPVEAALEELEKRILNELH